MLQRFSEIYKTNGLFYLLSRILHKLFSLIGIYWEVSFLLKQKIDIVKVDSYLAKHSSKYSVKYLDFNDFLNDTVNSFNTDKLNIIKNRFENAQVFIPIGAKDGNKLAYYSWLSRDQWEIDFGIKGECKGSILLLDDFCNPSYRNNGIHKYIIFYRLKTAYNLGYKEALVFIHWNNKPALNPQMRAGFKKYKICIALKIFNIKKLYTFNCE